MNFSKRIIEWQNLYGRNNLPWQTNDPYKVWVSEIMLQQTQVSTVIPFYENFIKSFPDVLTLSKANLDEVLNHWAGLGFYRRARNLHQTAKIITDKYHQVFPDNYEDLVTLPGIGESTAGAILSLAFNKKGTILDGNVKRILRRFYNISYENNSRTEKILWEKSLFVTPSVKTSQFIQGMMDVGSLVCTRSKPNCSQCPLRELNCLYTQNLSLIHI